MKKVVYSVAKADKFGNKITGIGYVTDADLITACTGQNGKHYVRIFEGCIKDCMPVSGSKTEFKGDYYELREAEFTTKHGSKETREIETEYSIWFKYLR